MLVTLRQKPWIVHEEDEERRGDFGVRAFLGLRGVKEFETARPAGWRGLPLHGCAQNAVQLSRSGTARGVLAHFFDHGEKAADIFSGERRENDDRSVIEKKQFRPRAIHMLP